MNRRHLIFDCEGSQLAGTLDDAVGATGLLIVSGGNEVRSGAWAGQAQLATRVAAEGFPVFRFDRRGVGDSEGANGGYRTAGPDIAAALAMFRAQCPKLVRIVALGNCDAASILMLSGGAGCDGLVLCNPWTMEENGEAADPPPQALRSHYRRRLADPNAVRRLLTGQVALKGLFSSLRKAAEPETPPSGLTREMEAGLSTFTGPAVILLAERDQTAQAFAGTWPKSDERFRMCPGASHSFVEAEARDWLLAEVLTSLRALK